MKEDKTQKYRKALFAYGFLTLLYLLNEFEQEENFEECEAILTVLTWCNSKFNTEIPTKGGKEAIAYFRKEMKERGLKGDTIISNIPFYAKEVKSDIENK